MPNTKTCTHIKVSGVRCGGPALRGEQFCYFHQHAHRSVRRPPFSRLHPMAIIEDEDSIQASLMEVINGLVRNTIDPKRAALILRALHIAVKNAGRVRLDSKVHTKVREIPEYATPAEDTLDPIPTESGSRVVLDDEAELPAVAAKEPGIVDAHDPHWQERYEDGGRILARQSAARRSADLRGARAPAREAVEPGNAAVSIPVHGGTGALARPVHVGTAAPGCPGRAATVVSANTAAKPDRSANPRKPPTAVQASPERKQARSGSPM